MMIAYFICKNTMCILFIAKNSHPDYPLIIAANRDEYFARPTEAPHWWPETPELFAGKDVQAGGTWMGYNRQQRIAAITNLRRPDLIQANARSRGELVTRFLALHTDTTAEAIEEFSEFLIADSEHYNPFNLLYGDAETLMVFNSVSRKPQRLNDGIHSISNGMPDEQWPKMKRGIHALETHVKTMQTLETAQLMALLQDQTLAAENELPDTGIPKSFEQLLSSIFIPPSELTGGLYGTRSSSVLWQGRQAEAQLEMISCSYVP